MSLVKKIIPGLLVVFVLMQFFRIDKTNPPVDPALDMVNQVEASPEVRQILKNACYDCHSYETGYPWYTNVAPVSWWVKDHINEGREELNFSIWGSYAAKKQDHKLEELGEEVAEGEMPLTGYDIVHPEARLTESQRQALVGWAKATRKRLGYQGGDNAKEGHGEEEHD